MTRKILHIQVTGDTPTLDELERLVTLQFTRD